LREPTELDLTGYIPEREGKRTFKVRHIVCSCRPHNFFFNYCTDISSYVRKCFVCL